MTDALLALELAAIAAMLVAGRWRRVPLFLIYLGVSIPLTASYAPEKASWWHGPFEAIAPIQVCLAIVANIEAIRNATHDAQRPFLTWLWITMALVGVPALVIVWMINDHPDDFAVIRDGRAAVIAGLAAADAIAIVTLWRFPSSLQLFDRRHLWLWSILMWKGAVLGVIGRLGLYPRDSGGIQPGMRIGLINVFSPAFGFPNVPSLKWGRWEGIADQVGAVLTACCLLLWIRAALKRGMIV